MFCYWRFWWTIRHINGTRGGDGAGAGTANVWVGIGGAGGGSFWGSNVDENRGDSTVTGGGQPGRQYGVGGSGGAETINSGNSNGGNASVGVVYVEEYA